MTDTPVTHQTGSGITLFRHLFAGHGRRAFVLLVIGSVLMGTGCGRSQDTPEKTASNYWYNRANNNWKAVLDCVKPEDRAEFAGLQYIRIGSYFSAPAIKKRASASKTGRDRFHEIAREHGVLEGIRKIEHINKEKFKGKSIPPRPPETPEEKQKASREAIKYWEKMKKVFNEYFDENPGTLLNELSAHLEELKPDYELQDIQIKNVKQTKKNRATVTVFLDYDVDPFDSTSSLNLIKQNGTWYVDWERSHRESLTE